MNETSKKEMQSGFMSLDLQSLKKDAEEVAGGWNGEDDRFQVGGTIYTEDDAHLAQEIVDACEKLESLLNEWSEINS